MFYDDGMSGDGMNPYIMRDNCMYIYTYISTLSRLKYRKKYHTSPSKIRMTVLEKYVPHTYVTHARVYVKYMS